MKGSGRNALGLTIDESGGASKDEALKTLGKAHAKARRMGGLLSGLRIADQ
jgi:hypothetical protein